ncbi:hypothetical protein HUU42_06560 [bacterium]|nr:hypothetical protein [bacterium]
MSHFEFLQTFETETDSLLEHYLADGSDFDFRSDKPVVWRDDAASMNVTQKFPVPELNRLDEFQQMFVAANMPDFKTIEHDFAGLTHLEMPKEFEPVFEKILKELEDAVERAHELTADFDEKTLELTSQYSF